MRLKEMINMKPLQVARGSEEGNFLNRRLRSFRDNAAEHITRSDPRLRSLLRVARRGQASLSSSATPSHGNLYPIKVSKKFINDKMKRLQKRNPQGYYPMIESTDVAFNNLMETPRWAREYEGLSSKAQKRIARSMLPAGKSRQVASGASRLLGDGAEKTVYKSVTGGVGPTATSLFHAKQPRVGDLPLKGSHKPGQLLDGATTAQRYGAMKELEKQGIGARLYAQHPRGYTMERMRPATNSNKTALRDLSRRIRRKASYYEGMGNNNKFPMAKVGLGSSRRTIADFDTFNRWPHNVMVDKKGRAKITDAIVINAKHFESDTVTCFNNLMEKEYIKGGLGDNKPDRSFPPRQLRRGVKVEMEHTNNPRVAKEIAKDHLTEIRDYYTRLAVMERRAKKVMKESRNYPSIKQDMDDQSWSNTKRRAAGMVLGANGGVGASGLLQLALRRKTYAPLTAAGAVAGAYLGRNLFTRKKGS